MKFINNFYLFPQSSVIVRMNEWVNFPKSILQYHFLTLLQIFVGG